MSGIPSANWRPDTMCNSNGRYKTWVNGKQRIYQAWVNMMRRCYDPESIAKEPTYKGCSVDIEWHDFQNFAQWYEENYPLEIKNGRLVDKLDSNGKRWHIDKDILKPGNKEYSPENCCFITQRLNKLFVDSGAARGELPLGVCMDHDSFQVKCNDGTGKQVGKNFRCLPDAIDHYWKFKFRVVLSACEEVSDYDEELGEQVMTYFTYFKNKHHSKEFNHG